MLPQINSALKKKDKDVKHDLQAATAKIEEFAMISQISLRERWGDLVL